MVQVKNLNLQQCSHVYVMDGSKYITINDFIKIYMKI